MRGVAFPAHSRRALLADPGERRAGEDAPGRKSNVNDATWLSDLLAHGLIRGSFVPPEPIQEMRDLTRTRKQLTRELVGLRSTSKAVAA
jgi:hypothetical protein